MRITLWPLLLLSVAPSCSDDGSTRDIASAEEGPAELPEVVMDVGKKGATVSAKGVTLVIPEGALEKDVTITATPRDAAQVALETKTEAISTLYEFGPKGTRFAKEITITFATSRSDTRASVYFTKADSDKFERIASKSEGLIVTAKVTHFSQGFVGVPELDAGVTPSGSDDGSVPDAAVVNTACVPVETSIGIPPPVDVIVAIDGSISMAPHICNVFKNLAALANNPGRTRLVGIYDLADLSSVTMSSCGTDPFTGTALASDGTRFLRIKRQINSNVDQDNSLSSILDTYPDYDQLLRSGATTQVVVITDTFIPPGTPGATFRQSMEGLLGHGFIFQPVVLDVSLCPSDGGDAADYMALAKDTGGRTTPLCQSEWNPLLDDLRGQDTLPCQLAAPASAPELVQVLHQPAGGSKQQFPRAVGVAACGQQNAWYYDGLQIALCPTACTTVRSGGTLSVGAGCAPTQL